MLFRSAEPSALERHADFVFGRYLVEPLAKLLFWSVPGLGMPVVVAWLLVGSIFFTVRMGFVNLRMFRHAIDLVRGRYEDPAAAGEVSHFQALATALSATVGLGNIAGVAIAVAMGGPGATLWMVVAGLLGMSAKFTEVTLGLHYRHVRPDGSIMGGAMYYLSDGLASRGMAGLGRVLAVAGGDHAVEHGIARLVHDAHGALAKLGHYFIAAVGAFCHDGCE